MKTTFFISFFLLTLLTSCVLKAQEVLNSNPHWVLTKCPQGPETLAVHDNYLFSGGEGGAYRSSDDGNTWEIVNTGLHSDIDPSQIVSFYSFGNYLLAYVLYNGGDFRTIDNGEYWAHIADIHPFGFFAEKGKYLFGIPIQGDGIFRSPDSGNSWFRVDTGFNPGPDYRKIVFSTPAVLRDSIYVINAYGEIYRSTNDGDSFFLIYSKISGTNHHLYVINDTTLFAYALDLPSDTLYRSTDGGFNWKVIKTDFGKPEIAVNGNQIFAASRGIILSSDNGDTWKSVNEGLPDSLVIDALAIKDGFLFAGSYGGGLWKRSLSDFTNAVKSINPQNQSSFVNVFGESIHISNVSDNIDKIVFYNAAGQIFKEIKNTGSTILIPVKEFRSGFYEVVFSTKGILTYTSKVLIKK